MMGRVQGVWPAFFYYLTVRCLQNPDQVTSFFGCCQMESKYLPLVYPLVFTLMNAMGTPFVRLDFPFACMFGYLEGYQYFALGNWFVPGKATASKIEQCGLCGMLPRWLMAKDTQSFDFAI